MGPSIFEISIFQLAIIQSFSFHNFYNSIHIFSVDYVCLSARKSCVVENLTARRQSALSSDMVRTGICARELFKEISVFILRSGNNGVHSQVKKS